MNFESHFPIHWGYIKDAIDEQGWVYTRKVPHILDYYFEQNTGLPIEYEKFYEGEWKGPRWRPLSIKRELEIIERLTPMVKKT